MLGNNAAARKEDALSRGLPPSDRVCWVPRSPCRCRRWRRWRCLPGCYATPAGELPRLTYTLFILTLVSGAFVILNEELVPQRRAQAAASPAPFPELGFRDAPLLQDTQAPHKPCSACREQAQLRTHVGCSRPDHLPLSHGMLGLGWLFNQF